jgi:hypothetical protein
MTDTFLVPNDVSNAMRCVRGYLDDTLNHKEDRLSLSSASRVVKSMSLIEQWLFETYDIEMLSNEDVKQLAAGEPTPP